MSHSVPNHQPDAAPGREENGVPARPSYAGLSDAQIIELAQRGQGEAAEYLLCKYRGLVRSRVRVYFLAGAQRDDLLQVGMIGLWEAIAEFRPAATTPFPIFAQAYIDRYIGTAIRRAP